MQDTTVERSLACTYTTIHSGAE